MLQYYPPFAYIVRTTQGVDGIENLEFVRWVGPYLDVYRIPADLLERAVIEALAGTHWHISPSMAGSGSTETSWG